MKIVLIITHCIYPNRYGADLATNVTKVALQRCCNFEAFSSYSDWDLVVCISPYIGEGGIRKTVGQRGVTKGAPAFCLQSEGRLQVDNANSILIVERGTKIIVLVVKTLLHFLAVSEL